MAVTVSLHLALKEQIELSWLPVCRGSDPPHPVPHLVSFMGPPRTALEWLSCCLPAGLGSLLLAKDLKQTWEVCARCQVSVSQACSRSQEGESHRVMETLASWRQVLILLLISEGTAGILDRFWVPHTDRDVRKLERV